MTPYFSIIIPVYNVAPYLRECLDSVLAQTFTDWEAICVDDGSTDGSGAILDEYAIKDDRFRVIHQKNKGVAAARNICLDVAIGKWVVFLDGDDTVSNKLIETVSYAVEKFATADLVRFGLNKNALGCCQTIMGEDAVFKEENLGSEISFEQYAVFFVQYAYKRDLIGDLRFCKFIHGEDVLFMGICLEKGQCLVSTDVVLYHYRQREGSAINRKMSYQALYDEVAFRVHWLSYMKNSKKQIDKRIIRMHELFATERAPFLSAKLRQDEFIKFRNDWYKMSERLLEIKCFSVLSNIIIWICLHFRSQKVFYVLCILKWRARVAISGLKNHGMRKVIS